MRLTRTPKILLSRGDVLGDVVITTALIVPIRKAFPGAKLYYLVRKDYIPLLEGIKDIDGLIEDPLPYSMKREDRSAFFGLVKTLRTYQFDVFLGLWENPRYAWLSFLAGIRVRIGHAFTLSNRILYTHLVRLDYLDYSMHKVDSNAALLKPLGIKQANHYPMQLDVKLETESACMARYPWMMDSYCMVHLDAGNPMKTLLQDNFVLIVRLLLKKPGLRVVLFGRSRNKEVAHYILSRFQDGRDAVRLIDCCDDVDLAETEVLIKHCSFLIGADSGPVHIAAGFQRPVLAYYLNRSQNAMHWGPWRTRHQIVKSIHSCVDVCRLGECQKSDCREQISTEALSEAIDALYSSKTLISDQNATGASDIPTRLADRYYWMQTSIMVGCVGPMRQEMRTYLRSEGWTVFELNPRLSLSGLKTAICEKNIGLLLVCDEVLEWSLQIKLEIVKRWAANFSAFYLKVMHVPTVFEFERQVSDCLASHE